MSVPQKPSMSPKQLRKLKNDKERLCIMWRSDKSDTYRVLIGDLPRAVVEYFTDYFVLQLAEMKDTSPCKTVFVECRDHFRCLRVFQWTINCCNGERDIKVYDSKQLLIEYFLLQRTAYLLRVQPMREALYRLIEDRFWHDRKAEDGVAFANEVHGILEKFGYDCWEADVALSFAAQSIVYRRLRFTDPLMEMFEASAVFAEAVVAKIAYQLVLGISEASHSFMIIYKQYDQLRELLHRCLE